MIAVKNHRPSVITQYITPNHGKTSYNYNHRSPQRLPTSADPFQRLLRVLAAMGDFNAKQRSCHTNDNLARGPIHNSNLEVIHPNTYIHRGNGCSTTPGRQTTYDYLMPGNLTRLWHIRLIHQRKGLRGQWLEKCWTSHKPTGSHTKQAHLSKLRKMYVPSVVLDVNEHDRFLTIIRQFTHKYSFLC